MPKLKDVLSLDILEFDAPEEALDDDVSEYLLEHFVGVNLNLWLALVLLLGFDTVQNLVGYSQDQRNLALDEVEVKDVAHDLLFAFPLVSLAEEETVSDDRSQRGHEGIVLCFYVAVFEVLLVVLPDELGINEVEEDFSLESAEGKLVVAKIILNRVLTISEFLKIFPLPLHETVREYLKISDPNAVVLSDKFFVAKEL